MKVLVVGGTGTIGRGVVPVLLERGHAVTVLARGETPRPFGDEVRFLREDRLDEDRFVEAMAEESFGAVIDLVCFNGDHARSALRAFRGIEHYLFVSTTLVYGGPPSRIPSDESRSPDPSHPYGRGKLEAERVLSRAHREEGFPVTTVRPTHVWGPGMPVARQLSLRGGWIRRILHDRPILVTRGGQTLSNHCHARDAGVALEGLIGRTETHGEVYHLSGPWMTWWDYHERVAAALGRTVEQVDVPLDPLLEVWPENPHLLDRVIRWHSCFTDRKLRRTLADYDPAPRLEEEIPRNVEWMRERGLLEAGGELDDVEDRILEVLGSFSLQPGGGGGRGDFWWSWFGG